jgi:hypothetical protein
MSINEVMNWTVNLEANTSQFMKDLNDAAKGINVEFDNKGLVKSFARAQGDIQKLLSDTVSAGATAGFSNANIKGLKNKLKPISEEIETSLKSIFDLQVKGSTEAAKNWSQAAKDIHAKAIETERMKMNEAERRFKLEKKSTDRLIKRRATARQDADRLEDRNASERAKDWMESIGGSFAKLKSGDLAGVLSGAGKGATARGVGMQDKAAAAGEAGGMMGKMGGLMAKIGPIIAGIGAVVGGFAALAAVVMLVDAAVKGLNKTMLDSGVAGADMASQFNQLGDTMDNIRKSATRSFGFNQIWGVSGKDHLEILGAFNAAGQTIHEMGTEMDRLRQYTQAALTYSKLLGLSTQEVSSSMASYMEELGLTLQGVQGRFSNITSAAKESGFGVKRFFNMVLQATSGMSMYNVRLEEAAGLLIQLGDILGEKMGGDFLQTLTQGFKQEGTQDRIKKTMTTGVDLSSRILRKDAVYAAEEFQRKVAELTEAEGGPAVQALLKASGLEGLEGEDFAKKVGSMSPDDLALLQEKLRQTGSAGAGLSRSLRDVGSLGKSFKGGLAGTQAARSSAGAGATLFLKLNEMNRLLGPLQDIDMSSEAGMRQMMAFEQQTGISGEEAMKLSETGKAMEAKFQLMQEAQGGTAADRAAFNDAAGKEFGIALDEATGKAFRQDADGNRVGSEIKNLEDFFIGIGSNLIGWEPSQIAEDILLAQEIASNTTDIASILERGIEWLLTGIYDTVKIIAGFMGAGLDKSEKAAKSEAIEILSEQANAAADQVRAYQKEIDALKDKRRTADSSEYAGIDAEIAGKEGLRDDAGIGASSLRRQLRSVQRINDKKGFFDWDKASDFTGNADRMDAPGRRADYEKTYGEGWEDKYVEELRRLAVAADPSLGDQTTDILGYESDAMFDAMNAIDPEWVGSGENVAARWMDDDRAVDWDELEAEARAADDQRTGDQTTDLEAAFDKQTDDLDRSADERERDALQQQVAGLINESGFKGDVDRAAAGILGGNPGSVAMGAEMPGGGTLFDALAAIGDQDVMRAALRGNRPANDFLMQIGAGGRVKFAQRINSADTVTATASKPGGPIQSSGRKGSGGSTVVINSFGNAAEVVRGIQAAVAAGVV